MHGSYRAHPGGAPINKPPLIAQTSGPSPPAYFSQPLLANGHGSNMPNYPSMTGPPPSSFIRPQQPGIGTIPPPTRPQGLYSPFTIPQPGPLYSPDSTNYADPQSTISHEAAPSNILSGPYTNASSAIANNPQGQSYTFDPKMQRSVHGGYSTVQGPTGSTNMDLSTDLSAGSEYVQCTLNRVPNSSSLKQKSHVPVGFIFRPLAPSASNVMEVNFASTGKVIRCHRCRTYVNPFCSWDSTGRRWSCKICGLTNECPPQYICPVDETGRRADRGQRPELSLGTVEFIAPGDYMVRPPQPPIYLFLIDVTAQAIASGLVATVCQGIKSAINTGKIPGGSRTQIGIMTFDSSVHFYELHSQTAQPHMVVVPSLAEVFIPLPDGVLVNLSETETLIRTLLDSLPSMWSNQKVTESCLGSAMNAAQTALKLWGGKLSVFISTLPTLGELTLTSHREKQTKNASNLDNQGTNDMSVFKPMNDGYKQLAAYMTQAQICVDLYICPPAGVQQQSPSMDLPTLTQVSQLTAGEVRYYPGFHALGNGDKLRQEIVHVLTRNSGWEAVMRIRVSRGWKIVNWTGHFYFRNNDLLVLPNCHEDQTFGVLLEFEENIVQDPYLYIQSALLYTNSNGERRIRVHTSCIAVTQNLNEVIHSINEPTVLAFLCYQGIEQALKTNLVDARTLIQTTCSQIYLAQCQLQGSTGFTTDTGIVKQPLLPLYALGLLKSACFRESRDVTSDIRIFHWLRMTSLPLQQLLSFCSPRLYSLHDISQEHGTPDSNQTIILPPLMGLSSSHMSQNGVYLLEDGESMMIWTGKGVDTQWIREVFAVDNLDHIHPDHADSVIGTSGTHLGLRVAAIVAALRQSQLPFMKLTVIRQGSSNEFKFFYALIEDRNNSCMLTYSEFLSKLGSRGNIGPISVPNPLNSAGNPVRSYPQTSLSQPPSINQGRSSHSTYHSNPAQGMYSSSGQPPLPPQSGPDSYSFVGGQQYPTHLQDQQNLSTPSQNSSWQQQQQQHVLPQQSPLIYNPQYYGSTQTNKQSSSPTGTMNIQHHSQGTLPAVPSFRQQPPYHRN